PPDRERERRQELLREESRRQNGFGHNATSDEFWKGLDQAISIGCTGSYLYYYCGDFEQVKKDMRENPALKAKWDLAIELRRMVPHPDPAPAEGFHRRR